jgi:hypothetical protein
MFLGHNAGLDLVSVPTPPIAVKEGDLEQTQGACEVPSILMVSESNPEVT